MGGVAGAKRGFQAPLFCTRGPALTGQPSYFYTYPKPPVLSKRKSPRQASPPARKPTVLWPLIIFFALAAFALYQSLGEANLCREGLEISAKVTAITSTFSEEHHYGRSIKIFNIELRYVVAGEAVTVIKTINDGEAGSLFANGAKVGDAVPVLVDEERPRRFELAAVCR